MRAPAVTVMALLVGCGEPTPLSCEDDVVCGAGLCVAGFCADYDPACASGLRYHESAGERAGDCTSGTGSGGGGTGTGAAEVHPLAESNTVDATNAHDDIAPACAAPGGKDVMFDINVQTKSRLYVDTYGTSYGVVLAVYAGACATLTPTSRELSCVDASCGPTTQQWSEILGPGAYCVVVDQLSSLESPGTLVVRSRLGLPSPLGNDTPATNLQNIASTCAPDLVRASCNAQSAGDASWFFMTCGQTTFWADTCDDTDFQGYLTAFGLGRAALFCSGGCTGTGVEVALAAPGPIWVVADDVASIACGDVMVYVATGVVQ